MALSIFVCEFVTGGGLGGRVAEGPFADLRHEGELMAAALCRDLMALPGVRVTLARDRALPPPDDRAVSVAWVAADQPGEPWLSWTHAASAHDALWPVAPETDGVLERLSGLAANAGRLLLGSTPDAVRLTASKSATAARLAAAGVPVVPTLRPEDAPDTAHGWVVKPDDGAGSDGVRHLPDRAALDTWRASGATAGMLLQPFVPGEPCSLSLLCRAGRAWILSVNRQRILLKPDGALHFRGCEVGALNGLRAELKPLADAVATAIPGLWGYVGVDLVLAEDGPVVVEVNPRLTTSYAGLGAVLESNPAALVLGLRDGEPAMPVPREGRTAVISV